MADLTRFDFHAMRFMYSEDVRTMSAEEVGQYVLLLCESWLGGKDASLPTSEALLSSFARAKGKVSPKVMKKFEKVDTPEWGERYRNSTLHDEWIKVQERSLVASENGRRGGSSISVYKVDAARENGKLGGRPSTRNNPTETQAGTQTQTKPYQAVPNQTKPSTDCDFRNLAVRYRKAFHVNLSHGQIQKDQYAKACSEFGEDVVLVQFDSWAPENLWIKERRHTNGLRQFYDSLSAAVEADVEIATEKIVEYESEAKHEAGMALALERGRKAAEESRDAILAKIAEEEKLAENLTENPF